MSFTIDDRVLALAGLAQALQQVRRIAETGQSDTATVRTAMESILRVDAPSVAAVYGGNQQLGSGLRLLHNQLNNQNTDKLMGKLALSVFQVERRLSNDSATLKTLSRGIERLQKLNAMQADPASPDLLMAAGGLYADTVSQLRPRIMVQGNPHYLGQANVVAEIRALLLAAVRSAVLWRQAGGNYWDFLLFRSRLQAAIQRQLE